METAQLPDLTPHQRRLLDEVHAYWRKHRRFPRIAALVVPLRSILDVRSVIGSMPTGIIVRDGARSENEVVKLGVLGLALSPSEESIVAAFLGLLRLAAKRVIAEPESKPSVTRTDLRELLSEVSQDEFDLVAPIIRDGLVWGGYGSPPDEWRRDPTLEVLRFENVRTMGEYLELASIEPKEVKVLGPQHVALLGEVYSRWCAEGEWPPSRDLIVAFRTRGDALRFLAEIPTRYLRRAEWSSLESKPVVLTLDGIAFTDRAQDDLGALMEIVPVLVSELEASPEDAQISIQELASRAKVPEAAAGRVAKVMADEYVFGVRIDESVAPTVVRVSDQILVYEHIRSFGDFLALREARQRSLPWSENMEMGDAALREGILRLFAAQPEDGSRPLNRTNVVGRPTQSGELEHFLNHAFSMEERGRASRTMRQLQDEGLLMPTMTDIYAPEDWLVITKAGRAALQAPAGPIVAGAASAREPLEAEFDAFLCHATEDKEAIVTPFAALMERNGLRPWLDVSQIGWGDSLVKSIEHGLTQSRFVIVFMSETSLRKKWTEVELRTALSMEVAGPKKVLPVILGIDHATLEKSHPFLAAKRYLTLEPYDPASAVSDAKLQALLEALKAELAKS